MLVAHVITRLIVGGAQENTIATVLGLRGKPDLTVRLVSGPTTGAEGSLEPMVASVPGLLTLVPSLIRPVRPWADWTALSELTKLFQAWRPQIVHTHSGKAGVLGRIAAHRSQVPLIIHTVHGPSFGGFQGALSNWIFHAAERYAARYTSHFITVAKAMTDQYLAAGIGRPDQYTRIFSGFPLDRFLDAQNDLELRARLGIDPTDLVIGTIARLAPLKGHDDLFAVAPAIIERCRQVKFLLFGDGPWRGRFEKRAEELGLTGKVIFTGLLPPEEVSRYIGIMDLLVHLSFREGLPRALPQALAAAKPVVAYDCDGAREVCLDNETGFLIPAGDRERLVDQIVLLANAPELRSRLGRTGQRLVRQWFPVEKMVDDIHRIYLSLCGRELTRPRSDVVHSRT